MRKQFFIAILISLIFASCNETGTSVFTVNQEEVTSTATGSMVVYIDQSGAPFSFTGNLKLVDGKCKVLLEAPVKDTVFIMDTVYELNTDLLPDSVYVIDTIYKTIDQLLRDTIYEQTFTAPVDVHFDESFQRSMGEWLFSYEILPLNKVDPYGSFEFTISYNN